MPGVAVGTDGMAGLYVRGGNSDENLYLVDGNPLYHVSHLLGFFSTFNPEAVKNTDFYKGSFPARYGGRLSSVVDVRMNDGDMKKFSGTASIGLISSIFNFQGPIIKDKTSFTVSLRRTYLDFIARPALYYVNKRNEKKDPNGSEKLDLGYYFYDFNAKITRKFSVKSRLYLSLYDGKDRLFIDNEDKNNYSGFYEEDNFAYNDYTSKNTNFDMKWGTRMASLNWAYAVNNKLFSSATFVYSRYLSDISSKNESTTKYTTSDNLGNLISNIERYSFSNPIYKSGIEDIGYRFNFDYSPNNKHLIRFGTSLLHHNFRPEESRIYYTDKVDNEKQSDTITFANDRVKVKELSFYAEDEMKIGDKLKINGGVHLSSFFVEGKAYLSAQPRIATRYLISDNLSLKASYGKMNQYVHLLQNNFVSLPTDLWVPITKQIKPLISDQMSVGIFGKLNDFDYSAEAYYKRSKNQIEYIDGATFISGNKNWEDRVAQGLGISYGIEILMRKGIGKTTGWLGYTLSWANRRFPNGEINNGETYPAKYDNRHKINIVLLHKINKKFDINLSWIYSTGNWSTIPKERYVDIDGNEQFYYDGRNNFKLPNFQRLDIGLNYYRKKKNGRMGIWNFSIYNAYGHHNSFLINPTEAGTYNPQTEQFDFEPVYLSGSLFSFIPSFSYTYKF